jgi:L-seryl-tRNA(Ser) seleniumtransferase
MVHTSNYQVVGFTRYATLEELVELGRKHTVPVVYDLGSGALVDLTRYGFHGHSVAELVAAGPDLVCFSGDKLLGGPQAGIIVGNRDAVEACRKSPFYRMMRPDKMTLALLEATLRVYLDPDRVDHQLPVLRMIRATQAELRPAADRLAARLGEAGIAADVEVFEDVSEIGGGSLSNQHMPTWCVGVRPREWSAQDAARALRMGEPSVFARVKDDRLAFDVRTLLPGEIAEVADALAGTLTSPRA